MQSLLALFRLGLGGLLLDPGAFRAQRDDPGGLGRGFALVLLVAVASGLAAVVGDLVELLARPDPAAVASTLYEGLRAMPWFAELAASDPSFATSFDQAFGQVAGPSLGGDLLTILSQLLLVPVLSLVGWLIYGAFAHLVARAAGGAASFRQTLACTALSAGANLLTLVQVVPFANVGDIGSPGGFMAGLAVTILGLAACYVAIREAHGLSSWRALAATLLGPLLFVILLGGLICAVYFLLISLVSAAMGA